MKHIDCIILSVLVLASCTGGEKKNREFDLTRGVTVENPFFSPYPAPEVLMETDSQAGEFPMACTFDYGDGRAGYIVMDVDDTGSLIGKFIDGEGRETVVGESSWMGSLSAMDIDHDGTPEILFHDGDGFSLSIFSIKKRGLRKAGTVGCNGSFIVAPDGLVYSMFGSQGGGEILRLVSGKLVKENSFGIDKLLFSSKRFNELVYDFEDTSEKDYCDDVLYPAERYIMCTASSKAGHHALKVDIDGDQDMEILYMGNPGWGVFISDEVRLLSGRESYDILSDAIEKDLLGLVDVSDYEVSVKECIQLSLDDVDLDGKAEVIASFGRTGRCMHLVYKYKDDAELEFLSVKIDKDNE